MADLDPPNKKAPLYLGLDFSTQQVNLTLSMQLYPVCSLVGAWGGRGWLQLKAVCIDKELQVTHEYNVVFDEQLPQYK